MGLSVYDEHETFKDPYSTNSVIFYHQENMQRHHNQEIRYKSSGRKLKSKTVT